MLSLFYVLKYVFAINAGLRINYRKTTDKTKTFVCFNLVFHHYYEGFTSAQRLTNNYHRGIDEEALPDK